MTSRPRFPRLTLPSILATAYLLAIPVFAWVYSRIPADFYHTTAKYELEYDSRRVLNGFTTLLRKLPSFGDSGRAVLGRWSCRSEDLVAADLRLDGPWLKFATNVRVTRDDGAFGSRTTLIRLSPDLALHYPSDSDELFIVYAKGCSLPYAENTFVGNSGRELLPQIFLSPPLPDSDEFIMSLEIPRALAGEFDALIKASYGFPYRVHGQYLRMLYLSAVTITTLGFGDILPLTNRARGLVTAQAILGVALAGLFLTALAQSTRSRNG